MKFQRTHVQRGKGKMSTNIESQILVHAIESLNALEGSNCDSVDIFARTENDANELKNYLRNYNVDITTFPTKYILKVSKMEKK